MGSVKKTEQENRSPEINPRERTWSDRGHDRPERMALRQAEAAEAGGEGWRNEEVITGKFGLLPLVLSTSTSWEYNLDLVSAYLGVLTTSGTC